MTDHAQHPVATAPAKKSRITTHDFFLASPDLAVTEDLTATTLKKAGARAATLAEEKGVGIIVYQTMGVAALATKKVATFGKQ